MKALKLAAVLLSTTALCCGALLGSAAAADAPQAKAGVPVTQPTTGATPAGTATADDIVVTGGTTTIRIKHVEVAGSSLNSADIAALFATKDAKALEARLRTLDAASIVIPEIIGDSAEGARQVHFTQKDVLLANVKGGRAATGSAATATLEFKDDKNDTRVSTGATTFKGLDLAQIVHLATGPRTDDGDAPRPICDEVAIQTVTSGGSALKDGRLSRSRRCMRRGLKGRPLMTVLGGSNDAKTDAAALNDIAHSFSADLVEANDFALAGPVSASTNGLKSLALKHLAARGLGDGRLARFEMIGLAMEGNDKQPGKLSLASAEIENVATNATPVPSIESYRPARLHRRRADRDGNKSGERITVAVAHAGYEAPGLVIGKAAGQGDAVDRPCRLRRAARQRRGADAAGDGLQAARPLEREPLALRCRRADARSRSTLDHRHRHGYARHQARSRQGVGGDRVAERRGGRKPPPPRWSSRPWT